VLVAAVQVRVLGLVLVRLPLPRPGLVPVEVAMLGPAGRRGARARPVLVAAVEARVLAQSPAKVRPGQVKSDRVRILGMEQAQTKILYLRIDTQIADRLKVLATAERRSISQQAALLLERALDAEENRRAEQ